ncbi:MAG: hypothetical protein LAN64_07505 [Acidobacteriia bacterium]|nr:hypothetical protein [Terriglobia bacterium]
MLLTCPNCKTKNFLDPYPFWNFKGTTQCAGCKKIWRLETSNGACVSGPEAASGTADLLPGFAETPAYEGISGTGLTRPAPKAQKETVCKPKAIKRNVRGNVIAGYPLTKNDLVGSRAKFMVAGAK